MLMRYFIVFLLAFSYSNAGIAHSDLANRPDVKKFIHQMVKKYHFKSAELAAALNDVKIRQSVMKSINTPYEEKPWYIYQASFVTESRIRDGVIFWEKHREALARAEKVYGVPAGIIVATIGVETKYGRNTGHYRVIDALATLAFSDSRRAPYFRNELKELFLLAREHHTDPLRIMGSYAGAIGQPQFMPSSYRHYAVDFSGNGKIDLSHNEVDVIGSIANYYKKHGWETKQPVAVQGTYMSSSNQQTKLIELQSYFHKEYWLAYRNFGVIKQYNPSNLYAMAVYQLSYYISTLREKMDNA